MKPWLAGGLSVVLFGCGGGVVFEPDGAGGGGSSTTSTVTGTTSTTTNTGTGGACSSHDHCPGGVCIFATGLCAAACEEAACSSCGAGLVCDGCATSGCPKCNDCVAACVPIDPGWCDDDDPCPSGQVCLFSSHHCTPQCQTDTDCGSTFLFCSPCATGCCGCDDCVSACVGGE